MKRITASRDKLFNVATIGVILTSILVSSFLDLGILADIIALVAFGTLSAMNKITFKDGKFFNSQEQDLTNRLPTKFGEWSRVILLATFLGFIIGIIPFGYNLFASVLVFILSYFVFTDCPMSILLSDEGWQNAQSVFGIAPLPKNEQTGNTFDEYYERRRSSPSMSNNPCNNYYKSHK